MTSSPGLISERRAMSIASLPQQLRLPHHEDHIPYESDFCDSYKFPAAILRVLD